MKRKQNYRETSNFTNNEQNALLYKDHSPFFHGYYVARENYLNKLIQFEEGQCQVIELISAIKVFIDYTSNYIGTNSDLKSVWDTVVRIKNMINGSNRRNDIIIESRKLFWRINKFHSYNELIPQVQEQEEDPTEKITDDYARMLMKAYEITFTK